MTAAGLENMMKKDGRIRSEETPEEFLFRILRLFSNIPKDNLPNLGKTHDYLIEAVQDEPYTVRFITKDSPAETGTVLAEENQFAIEYFIVYTAIVETFAGEKQLQVRWREKIKADESDTI